MRKFFFLGLLFCVSLGLVGCASITTGKHQRVPIDSNPQGAEVTVSSGYRGITPCSFELERNKQHVINIAKEGYKTAQVTLKKTVCGSLAGNLIVGGVIGVGVDAMTGAMWKLTPESVYVDLVPGKANEVVVLEVKAEDKTIEKVKTEENTTEEVKTEDKVTEEVNPE